MHSFFQILKIIILSFILISTSVVNAQTDSTKDCCIIISGRVTDDKGKPLPFANVFQENACMGTTTDTDGYYSIRVSLDWETNRIAACYPDLCDIIIDLKEYDLKNNPVVNIVLGLDRKCMTYSRVQDPPRGRTLPELLSDWVGKIKEKRGERKVKPQAEITTTHVVHTQEIESEITEIRPPKIITNKLITNVFPNPFDDKIRVTLQSKAVETLRLVMYDSMSRGIYAQKINVLLGTNEFDLDLKGKQVENGSYFLSVLRGEEVIQTEILMRVE